MEFVLDDDLLTSVPPRIVTKIVDALDLLEDGKLVSQGRLAEMIGHATTMVSKYAAHRDVRDRKLRICHAGVRRNYFGNTRTIAAYLESHPDAHMQ